MIVLKLILPGGILVPVKLRKRELETIYQRLRLKPHRRKKRWFQKVAAVFRLRKGR